MMHDLCSLQRIFCVLCDPFINVRLLLMECCFIGLSCAAVLLSMCYVNSDDGYTFAISSHFTKQCELSYHLPAASAPDAAVETLQLLPLPLFSPFFTLSLHAQHLLRRKHQPIKWHQTCTDAVLAYGLYISRASIVFDRKLTELLLVDSKSHLAWSRN